MSGIVDQRLTLQLTEGESSVDKVAQIVKHLVAVAVEKAAQIPAADSANALGS